MKIKDIYPLLGCKEVLIWNRTTNKVYSVYEPEYNEDLILSEYGDLEVVKLVPLNISMLQITTKQI